MNRPIPLNEIDFVIYHDPCSDGQHAALIFKKACLEHGKEIILLKSDQHFKPELLELLCNKKGICVDVVPKNIIEIENNCIKLYILDHHKTNQEIMVDKTNSHFNMDKSGTGLAFEYCYGDVEMPYFLRVVQARDLFKIEKKSDDEIFCSGLYEMFSPFKIEILDYYTFFLKLFDNDLETLNIVNEYGINSFKNTQNAIEEKLKEAIIKTVMINKTFTKNKEFKNEYKIVYFNDFSKYKSDYLNACMNHLDIDFCFSYTYSDKDKSYWYSFRSLNHKTDASEICKLFQGGGGHRNACGMESELHPSEIFLEL